MRDLLQTTAFGQLLRLVSGGRILGWEEHSEPSNLNQYLCTKVNISSLSSSSDDKRVTSDVENGCDEYYLIDWMDSDPKKPMNWSNAKKAFVTAQLCILTTTIYLSAAIYTAGIQGVQQQFQVSEVAALLGLTLFVAGYGLGPMVWAPLSEMPFFGRNPVYIGTLIAFVGMQPAVVYAKNFGTLLAFRFLTGLFGSPVLATGGASIVDMYTPSKRAYAISIWGVAAILGPVMGPLVGGFAVENKGWTWTIWEITWLSGACLVMLIFFLPETSTSHLIFARTGRLRKVLLHNTDASAANTKLKCEPEIEAEHTTPREILLMLFVRPFTLSFFEPIVLSLNLYISLLYALIYLWFESFPIVFLGTYRFNEGQLGLAFIGILVGSLVAIAPFWWHLHRYVESRFNANGEIKPEHRLPPACLGGFFIPVSLFWFGWTARASVHWIVPIVGTLFFTPGAFLLFNSVL
ncbi:MFS general substrate transporter, partial [Lepidopterella palustris CBS 459.81]